MGLAWFMAERLNVCSLSPPTLPATDDGRRSAKSQLKLRTHATPVRAAFDRTERVAYNLVGLTSFVG